MKLLRIGDEQQAEAARLDAAIGSCATWSPASTPREPAHYVLGQADERPRADASHRARQPPL